MPQMGPILWLNFLLTVLVIYSLFFCFIYFTKISYGDHSSTGLSGSKNKVWEW